MYPLISTPYPLIQVQLDVRKRVIFSLKAELANQVNSSCGIVHSDCDGRSNDMSKRSGDVFCFIKFMTHLKFYSHIYFFFASFSVFYKGCGVS